MITVNRIGEEINGDRRGTPYRVPYTKELFDKLKALAQQEEDASSVDEQKAIAEKFRKMVSRVNNDKKAKVPATDNLPDGLAINTKADLVEQQEVSEDRQDAMSVLEKRLDEIAERKKNEAIKEGKKKEVKEKPVGVKSSKKISDTKEPSPAFVLEQMEQGKTYLVYNGVPSRFYIPDPLLSRIRTSQEKDIGIHPVVKLFIDCLRNEVMTQDKLDKLAKYLDKKYRDPQLKEALIKKGYTEEQAEALASGFQNAITRSGMLTVFKRATDITPKDVIESAKQARQIMEKKQLNVSDDELLKGFKYKAVREPGETFKYPAKDSAFYIIEHERQRQEYMNRRREELTEKVQPETAMRSSFHVNQDFLDKDVYSIAAEDRLFLPPCMGTGGAAFYCDTELGHNIRVGKVHYLPNGFDQVNCNDDSTCVPGLHVGNIDYIKGYTGFSQLCFVSGADIGAVVDSEGALRVKRYFVAGLASGPIRGLYHSSTHGELVEAEWKEKIEAIYAKQKANLLEAERLRKEAERQEAEAKKLGDKIQGIF